MVPQVINAVLSRHAVETSARPKAFVMRPIGGLVFATFATLLLVPILYRLLHCQPIPQPAGSEGELLAIP